MKGSACEKMTDDFKGSKKSQREFAISKSRKPVLRAGWSNLIIAMMVGFAYISQKAALHFDFGYALSMMAAAMVGALFFVIYTRSLSRIAIDNSSMVFECAIHSERYETENIRRIRVLGITSSYWTIVAVFMDRNFFPRIFHFSELHPSFAKYREAVSNLREFFRRTNANWTPT